MTTLEKNAPGEYRLRTQYSGLSIGVAAKAANTVDYSADSAAIRLAEKKLLEGLTGISTARILALNQLHEDTIIDIREVPRDETLVFGEADGLMTGIPGICLVIRTADCVPVFAYDRERRVLGAAHSGWRGTRLGIARKMVRQMKERYGSAGGDISAYILPSIGPESYTVGKEVAELFPGDITERGGLLYLSLWRSIESSLRGEGIPEGNIFNARLCTRAMNHEFFSHRAGDLGRNLNFGILS